jgi:amino-acid N-acetyltransferase
MFLRADATIQAATTPAAPVQPFVRRARACDVDAIAALVNAWAAEDLLLPRTPGQIALMVDDYVVATDARGRLLACGALRAYSPSLAELVSLAVSRATHGRGLGRLVVAEVERLARVRGYESLFAHTLVPAFFESVGYERVDRAMYPEKSARAHTSCLRRDLTASGAGPYLVVARAA